VQFGLLQVAQPQVGVGQRVPNFLDRVWFRRRPVGAEATGQEVVRLAIGQQVQADWAGAVDGDQAGELIAVAGKDAAVQADLRVRPGRNVRGLPAWASATRTVSPSTAFHLVPSMAVRSLTRDRH
jgi:hypothetical protein